MNFQTKNILNKKIKVAFFIFILMAAFLFPAQKPAQAVVCWFLPCSGLMAYAMDLLKSAATSIIKQKGIEALDKAMNGSVGGKYITDWTKALTGDPQKASKTYLNDYLTKTIAGGKSSASNYITKEMLGNAKTSMNTPNFEGVGPNSFKTGLFQNDPEIINFVESANASYDLSSLSSISSQSAGNYLSKLVTGAKEATINKIAPSVTYTGNPTDMFKEGETGFKKLTEYTSGINNPWAFESNAEVIYEKKLEEKTTQAETMAIAYQGWVGDSMKDGKISGIPGGTASDIFAHIKTLGADAIVNAQDIATATMAVALNALASKAFDGEATNGQTDESDDSTGDAKNLENRKQTKEQKANANKTDELNKNSKKFDFFGGS